MAVNVAKLVIAYTYAGIDCVTTHHFRAIDEDKELVDLLNHWDFWCEADFLAVLPPEYELRSVEAIEQPGPGTAAKEGVIREKGTAGTRAHAPAEDLPPWLVIWSTVRTAQIGRRARGRYALSGGTEGDVAGTEMVGGGGSWIGRAQDYADSLVTAFTAGHDSASDQWEMVVYSRKQDDSGSSSRDSCQLVTSIAVRPFLRNLRARQH